MELFKQINIKNRSYYFCDDMINIKNFHSNLLTINKKSHKEIDIYNIGYIIIKKFSDYGNIYSVNPLHLIIHSATGYFKEKNGEKYLILHSTDKYGDVWSGIRLEIKTLSGGKELLYEKNNARIGINTEDDLPLNKQLKFAILTIIIRCVLQRGEQLYLDECLYELVV